MKNPTLVHNRVFKINVGFLLTAGPGLIHDSELDIPAVRVAEDLYLKYIHGPLRLSRTKEGILVQANLEAGVDAECYRCLDVVERDISINLEELFAYPAMPDTEFSVNTTGQLDLAPLVRAEILIAIGQRVLCREDCKGLCAHCGTNLNTDVCDCAMADIDPRLAPLKALLDSKK